jgi:cobyric acid synthase
MRRARPQTVMITGPSSDVGKSFIATGLVGAAHRRYMAVALFKAINISNNVRATPFGEVPTSQFVPAVGLAPHPRFSPLLVKFAGDFVGTTVTGESSWRRALSTSSC